VNRRRNVCAVLRDRWQQGDDVAGPECGERTVERGDASAVPACEAKEVSIGHLLRGGRRSHFR
jgi:hypothetical protein